MRADRRVLPGLALIRPAPIRPGRDADAAGFIALIETCWADYPGCVLDVDAEAPHLRALATHYAGRGGALFVAGEVEGMAATAPLGDGLWEICQVYVHPRLHGTGLGGALLEHSERHALASGATRLMLWTDTRFLRAHRFYEKHGYVHDSRTRALHDIAATIEYAYAKSCPAPQRR